MAKRLIWSTKAKQELAAILEYWDERNKSSEYSKKLSRRILDVMLAACKNPLIGKATDNPCIRVTFCDNYLLVYEVFENEVLLLSIFDGRRNPVHLRLK